MRRAFVLLALAGIAPASGAQSQRRADHVVEGRVRRPGENAPVPVGGGWVVLHRVGSDAAAPLDSMRAGADGSYRFTYARTGAEDAIYFVSTMFRGIAYFSSPLRARVVRGDDGSLLVYDTTTSTSDLSVTGRHLVVSAPRNGKRDVAEIFEIENDGRRTVVPRDSLTPHWAVPTPELAESLAIAPGDLSEGAVTFRRGRAEVYAPISPGARQLVITYRLPLRAFPLSVPIDRPVAALEVLLEEPRAVVDGAGLVETAGVDIDGRRFRRFLARGPAPPAVLRLKAQAPSSGGGATIVAVAAVVTLAMAGALSAWFARRRPVAASAIAPADILLAELASLDARFERITNPGADVRGRHEAQRAALKARIAEALAAPHSPV